MKPWRHVSNTWTWNPLVLITSVKSNSCGWIENMKCVHALPLQHVPLSIKLHMAALQSFIGAIKASHGYGRGLNKAQRQWNLSHSVPAVLLATHSYALLSNSKVLVKYFLAIRLLRYWLPAISLVPQWPLLIWSQRYLISKIKCS